MNLLLESTWPVTSSWPEAPESETLFLAGKLMTHQQGPHQANYSTFEARIGHLGRNDRLLCFCQPQLFVCLHIYLFFLLPVIVRFFLWLSTLTVDKEWSEHPLVAGRLLWKQAKHKRRVWSDARRVMPTVLPAVPADINKCWNRDSKDSFLPSLEPDYCKDLFTQGFSKFDSLNNQ